MSSSDVVISFIIVRDRLYTNQRIHFFGRVSKDWDFLLMMLMEHGDDVFFFSQSVDCLVFYCGCWDLCSDVLPNFPGMPALPCWRRDAAGPRMLPTC